MNIIRRFLGWLACEPKEYINPAIPLSLRWKFHARHLSHRCPICRGEVTNEYMEECEYCEGSGFWGSKERQRAIDAVPKD